MLSRGFLDSLSIWPAIFWPIVFTSCFVAFLRLCRQAEQRFGFSPLNGRRKTDYAVRCVALPLGAAIEVAVHSYLIFVIGPFYALVAIPVYVVGWVLLPYVLDGFRPGLTVLALIHVVFVAAFGVYLGLYEVSVLRALNGDIYGMLLGVPTNL